jgi:uncharacterized phage protein (TIGR02220 family)
MAIFRKIHTSFWSDSFIQDLEKDHKLFYLYLLTNERTRQCGVYEITKKQISYDLGYNIDRVSILLEYFIKVGKIKYNDVTKEIAIGNWLKYNNSTSPKVKSCIDKEFGYCKDTLLIEYVKSMDTASQEEQEEEQEEIINVATQIDIDFKKLLEYFNKTTNKNFKTISDKVKKSFNARIKEGYTKNDIMKAILNCSKDKYHIENPKYLTPEFISRPDKFIMYLNAEVKTNYNIDTKNKTIIY